MAKTSSNGECDERPRYGLNSMARLMVRTLYHRPVDHQSHRLVDTAADFGSGILLHLQSLHATHIRHPGCLRTPCNHLFVRRLACLHHPCYQLQNPLGSRAHRICLWDQYGNDVWAQITHSVLFNAFLACSASSCVEKRTKPKPRLRFVSRSLTTTCAESDLTIHNGVMGRELPLPQPGHTAGTHLSASDRWYARPGLCKNVNELAVAVRQCSLTYPMNNFVVGF